MTQRLKNGLENGLKNPLKDLIRRSPVQDDGLLFGAPVGDVHVGDAEAVGGGAVVVQEDVHLEGRPRLHVQIIVDEAAVLLDCDAQHRLHRPSFHYRYVVLPVTNHPLY